MEKSSNTAGRSSGLMWLAGILLSSFLGKVGYRLAAIDLDRYWTSGYSFYHRMATGLLHSGRLTFGGVDGIGGYPCFRPPGYPAFMAAISWLTDDSPAAFIVCEALVSTVTVALVFWIGRLIGGTKPGLVAAALYAFLPYPFVHDTQQQETALYTCLATLSVALIVRGEASPSSKWWPLLAGLAAGGAVLTRASHLVPALALFIAAGMTRKATTAQKVTSVALVGIGLAGVVTPWMIRNRAVSGHFALTSESGFALARAHNASTFDYYPTRSIDLAWGAYHRSMSPEKKSELEVIRGDEFKTSDWYRREAVQYIEEHPGQTLQRGVIKALVNFAGVMSPLVDPLKNWTYSISFWGLTLAAALGIPMVLGSRFWTCLWVVTLAQAAVSFVFWAHTSHRAYLDPLLAVPAGIFLFRFVRAMADRQRQPASPAGRATTGHAG